MLDIISVMVISISWASLVIMCGVILTTNFKNVRNNHMKIQIKNHNRKLYFVNDDLFQ